MNKKPKSTKGKVALEKYPCYQLVVAKLCQEYVDIHKDDIIYPTDETEMDSMKGILKDKLTNNFWNSLGSIFYGGVVDEGFNVLAKEALIEAIDWDAIVDEIYAKATLQEFSLDYFDCTRSFLGYKGQHLFIAHNFMSNNPSNRVKNIVPMQSKYVIGFNEQGYQAFSFKVEHTNPIALVIKLEREYEDWNVYDPINVNNLLMRLKARLRTTEFDTVSNIFDPVGAITVSKF